MSNNEHQTKEKKVEKTKKKLTKLDIFARIVLVLMVLGITAGIGGVWYISSVLKTAPEFSADHFKAQESSKIFDSEGNLIGDVGLQIRENIVFEDLPQSVVDAFVSIEDSRFFEHNGFDIPRFVKAILVNLQTMSFSEGGSTFTMQLVKGTYFETEDATAPRQGLEGVNRKINEIYMALKAEREVSKERILELYLNRINYGVPENRRGIQTAAHYYFGKDVSELNLIESAMLAGVINAPNANNPMKNLERATRRTHTVLELMHKHGYITDEELVLNKAIPLENILVGELPNQGAGELPYQAYIDTVLKEVKQLTGFDPVYVPMHIYTHMDKTLQEKVESIQRGEVDSIQWPNEHIQNTILTMNNQTGEILAIGGGRYYEGERLFNRATDMRRQPGSSAKLVLTYPLAFEYLGWSTQHTLSDRPFQYPGMNVQIKNFDNVYRGDVQMPYAIGVSLNIPAVETMWAVTQKIGNRAIAEYLDQIGFSTSVANAFDLGYGIGGSNFLATPVQMAGAYSAMLNAGEYIRPHTVKTVQFLDGMHEDYHYSFEPRKVLSAQAAYLTALMMEQDVSGPYSNYMQILRRSYPVYAKTGTSDWGDEGLQYGIPRGSAKDKWMIAGTSEFTTTVWIGYDKGVEGQISYLTNTVNNMNLPGRINSEILNTLYADRDRPKAIERPSGVSQVTIIPGLYPYASPTPETSYLGVTGWIKSDYANIPTLYTPAALSSSYTVNNGGSVSGTLRAYAPYGQYLSFYVTQEPKHGYFEYFEDWSGNFNYIHNGNTQSDSFKFVVSDGTNTSSEIEVLIGTNNPQNN